MALQGFDKDYYLQAKLDALVAKGETEWADKDAAFLETVLVNVYGLTPEDHYSQYGYAEGLAPNAYFNAAEYKLAKAAQLFDTGYYMTEEDALADFEAKWEGDVYQHYLQYGSAEGINPSNAFDESSYLDSKLAALQANPDTSADWADKTADDVQAAFTAAGLTVLGHYIAYGQDEGIAVTPVPEDEQVDVDESPHGVVGETFTLTTAIDTVTGTSGDDLFIALDEDDITDTLTLGDDIDGGAGTDTLKIFSDNDALTLATLQVSNVEKLLVINAHENWDDFDVASRDFDEITLDVGGLDSGGLKVDNVNASTAVTMTNIFAADESNYIYFNTDNTSTVGTTSVTISDVDMSDSHEYFEVEAEFTAADTVNTTVNLSDIEDQEHGDYGEYSHYLDTGATMGVAVNTTVNVENVVNADYFGVYFYVDQAGGSVNDVTVNLTDTDNVDFWMFLDDDGNGTSSEDVVTLNLDGVANSNGEAEFYTTDAETFNVNVLSDSELEYIGDYYNGDSSDMGDVVVNLNAAADLTVGFWDLNDNSGVTENTTFNIIGSGNVTIEDFDDGSSNVTVDASTATGNISLDNLESEVVSVTTGSGDDSITVGSYETTVSTGDGDDTVDTAGYDFGDADAETIDGGNGTDTVAIIDNSLINADFMANIVNFETLEIAGAINVGNYDMDIMDFIDIKLTNTAIAAATGITNAAATAALTFTATSATAATVNLTAAGLSYALEDATGTSDSLSITLNANDTGTNTGAGNEDGQVVAALVANGIETVSVESNATTASEESAAGEDDQLTEADYTNTFTLIADDAETINLSGDAMINLTVGANDGGAGTIQNTAVTFIDATANTAGVTVDMSVIDTDANVPGDNIAVNTSAVTFSGTDVADTYTASHNGDTIQANGGADEINLSDNGALTVPTNADETIRYVAATDSQLTLKDTSDPADDEMDTATGFDIINNFGTAGTDIIELSSLLGLATGDARSDMLQLGTIADGGNSLADDLDTFIGDGVDLFNTGLVDRAVAFADDVTGDGWIFIDANSDGNFTQADDIVINLAGVTSLAITDISFG